MDTSIAGQIFQEVDVDNSGVILMQEFVEAYFVKQRQVKERITELEASLAAHNKSRE